MDFEIAWFDGCDIALGNKLEVFILQCFHRILRTTFLKKIHLPAFLVPLRNKGGRMHVQSN